MPTLYEERGYAFRFRSSDGPEPPHVPVEGNDGVAKFWLGRLLADPSRIDEIRRFLAAQPSERA